MMRVKVQMLAESGRGEVLRRIRSRKFLLSLWGAALCGPMAAQDLERLVLQEAKTLEPRWIETRRELHRHPELSNREVWTSAFVAQRLQELGLDVKSGIAHHGILGVLKGGKPGPVVAFRADMDALPIQEKSEKPYASKQAGVMHACGHDVHMTVALGVAEILARHRDRLPGSVKFLFQPAEEGPPAGETGGAKLMIEEGALEHPKPSVIFAFHTNPAQRVGSIGYISGHALAAMDRLSLTIKGKMSHGAMPHQGVDAIVVAAECVTALQTIASLRLDPVHPMVLSFGTIQGGSRDNILAESVMLKGTLRTLDPEARKQILRTMREILAGVTQAHGATYELQIQEVAPSVHNDPALVQSSLPPLVRALGQDRVQAQKPWMVSEDFALYQQHLPGVLFFLGVGNPEKGITASLHSPHFDVDEACLTPGIQAMAAVVLEHLQGNIPPNPIRNKY